MTSITASGFSSGNSFSRRNLFAIVVVCFLAPMAWVNLRIGYVLLVYRLIGFTPNKVTYWTVRGCLTQNWMHIATFFAFEFLSFPFLIAGLLLSRKGYKEKSNRYLLAGAVSLYPIADRLIWTIIRPQNPLWFVAHRARFEKMPLAGFGDLYTFKWAVFWIDNAVTILMCVVVYVVVFHYWYRSFRQSMLILGALSCGIGWLFWFFWLGPIVYWPVW